jgi:hypothetical protein
METTHLALRWFWWTGNLQNYYHLCKFSFEKSCSKDIASSQNILHSFEINRVPAFLKNQSFYRCQFASNSPGRGNGDSGFLLSDEKLLLMMSLLVEIHSSISGLNLTSGHGTAVEFITYDFNGCLRCVD